MAFPPADRTWQAYSSRFSYFNPADIRPGCAPQRWLHLHPALKAIVLVHGLSDSPYYMTALARYFHTHLGYDVYVPLLQGHGLHAPEGMEHVELAAWKANVAFAVDEAATRSVHVSAGGLSTGGALALHAAATHPKVTGDVFLFSAALDLGVGFTGLLGDALGEVAEYLLRTFLADVLDDCDGDTPLVGRHPYRYTRVDKDGARELAYLLTETDALQRHYSAALPFPKRVFAAHSACDTTAHLGGIEDLQARCAPEDFTLFRLPEHLGVPHASVVLDRPITTAAGDVLEPANPWFDQMTTAVATFAG